MHRVTWWRTSFGDGEIEGLRRAIVQEHITAGPLTEQLEQVLARGLGVPYAVVTTSGSAALLMSLMVLDIGPGDEVIVPNRGWIATAHAVLLAGAKVVLVDSMTEIPTMDVHQVRKKITARTKAIIPVHLNGRSVDMEEIHKIAEEYKLYIIEDACQALFSRNASGFLGTQSDLGCFSLGITKLVSTGQGGFIVTRNKDLYEQLKLVRNHGVRDIFTNAWSRIGFNFKFTDILASVGLVQLERARDRIVHLNTVYRKYAEVIAGLSFLTLIPVRISYGEIPLYIEVLCREREKLVEYMLAHNIQVRLSNPSAEMSPHIFSNRRFPNSKIFEEQEVFLPCGPAQSFEDIDYVLETLKAYQGCKCA